MCVTCDLLTLNCPLCSSVTITTIFIISYHITHCDIFKIILYVNIYRKNFIFERTKGILPVCLFMMTETSWGVELWDCFDKVLLEVGSC